MLAPSNTRIKFNISQVRQHFPMLQQVMSNNYPLIYLDNAATTQKPNIVIDTINDYYKLYNANVHRSVHNLSAQATLKFEDARNKIQRFIHAPHAHECIFVRGTTEGINLVAQSFVAPRILPGEEILITHMEHHSNIVPWQMVCKKTGAKLSVASISYEGEILLDEFAKKITSNTKFVAISYVSNVLGTINPVKEMIKIAHDYGALVLLDGAQATAHLPVNITELDCDFYVFSSHKMYGPTGVGVLWGREELLDLMPPYQGGGEMISNVTFAATEYAPLPYKFEAGTPDISGVIGFGAAIDFLESLDLEETMIYEKYLLDYTTSKLKEIKGINLIGTAKHKIPIVTFVHGKIHAHDIGTILDSEGIAVRSGHHCAMPLMDFFKVAATTRISLAFYNTIAEIDILIKTLHKIRDIL